VGIFLSAAASRLAPAREKFIHLHGHAFVADFSGALYWPEEHMLIVADLHLEKGSAYAARRVFLPPYDTTATLAALGAVIARLVPKRVVALGDSFHDGAGAGRMLAHDAQALRALQTGRDWLWIAGNHDPAPLHLKGDHAEDLRLGAIHFRHEPRAGTQDGEIAGHLHPAARVASRSGVLRRRCFVSDGRRLILPAFGAYTGGLNIHDAAFATLFTPGEVHAHVPSRDAVYTVARRQCLAEAPGLAR
jgi:DNA ligase-associated metallophosphoesterase